MIQEKRIRILLVEDNFFTRLGTMTFLEDQPDLEIVGQASDGADALTQYRACHPDVVVADLKMPKLDGVQLTAALQREDPPARVLVLTNYDGDETVIRALRAGALGYLTKEVHGDELLRAVRAVATGERHVPASLAGRVVEQSGRAALTPRELDVLEKVSDGLSNGAVAQALGLTKRTAGLYVSKILAKLDAKNRTDAVRIAADRGILDTRPHKK